MGFRSHRNFRFFPEARQSMWGRSILDAIATAVFTQLALAQPSDHALLAQNSAASKPGPSSGSGFVVSNAGHIVTNSHVVKSCIEVDSVSASGERSSGRVVAVDERNDLALISTGVAQRSVATFRKSPLRSGDDVIALGYPYRGLLATDVNVSVGIVSATAGLRNDTSQLQISAPVQPGNSGGPLLDSAGAVSGVVVAKLDALAVAKIVGDIPQNINFAIKGEIVQVFLRSNRVEPRMMSEPAKRIGVSDAVQVARGYTVIVECEPGRSERLDAERRAQAERAEAERRAQAERLEAERREVARRESAAREREIDESLRFGLPIRCEFGKECAVIEYFDHGGGRDFACGFRARGRSTTTFGLLPFSQERRDIPVIAAAAGQVTYRMSGDIVLDHGGGWTTSYKFSIESSPARVGDRVADGDVLGYVGPRTARGVSIPPSIDFEVRKNGRGIDPFRPDGISNCGLAANTRWKASVLPALGYENIVVDGPWCAVMFGTEIRCLFQTREDCTKYTQNAWYHSCKSRSDLEASGKIRR